MISIGNDTGVPLADSMVRMETIPESGGVFSVAARAGEDGEMEL